jgi:hypothetical protein
MSVDHTRVAFYSGYQAFKNLGVYETTIEVDTTAIAPGAVHFWERTITVGQESRFATLSIQANEFNGGGAATALKWQSFPSSEIVYVTLSLDPEGNGNSSMQFSLSFDDDQVTFSLGAYNPYLSNIAFANTTIGVRFATHNVG